MFIATVPESAATGDLADYYAQQRAGWGFLPDYVGAFSPAPEVAQAWNGLNLAIRGRMDRRRFEIATIAAARALRSTYCTAAHSLMLRRTCGDEATLRSLAEDPSGASLPSPEREIFAFAAKVAVDASSVTQDDVEALHAAGLSDAEVADVVYAAAARAFFTKVLDGLGAQADPEIAASTPSDLVGTMVVGRPFGAA